MIMLSVGFGWIVLIFGAYLYCNRHSHMTPGMRRIAERRRRLYYRGVQHLCQWHVLRNAKQGQMAVLDGEKCELCAKEAKNKA